MWLVSRRNQPARYILCESFLVDDVGERSRNWLRNFAAGSRGHAFSPPVIIDGERWFKNRAVYRVILLLAFSSFMMLTSFGAS